MANDTAKTVTTNIVPVQGTFEPLPPYECINLIGPAGTPFFAPINPDLDGVTITNSTIDSSTIGQTTPAAAAFTTASATNQPIGNNDLTTKLYVDSLALGISWKQPVNAATTANITLSGTQTIDTVALIAGDRVLVKNQTAQAENGIYVVAAGAWSRSPDADNWDELVSALVFVESGGQAGAAFYCPVQPGGTLGTTAVTWNNFAVGGVYFAGTGLTLTGGDTFNLDVPVTAANGGTGQTSYTTGDLLYASGSAALSKLALGSYQRILTAGISAPEWTLPANVSVGNATNVTISPTSNNTNFYLAFAFGSGSNPVQIDGGGNATYNPSTNTLTVPNFVGDVTGNASTATTATAATNLGGGATGSLPYQSGAGTTTFLAAGSNGQYLTLSGGVPAWATLTPGDVIGPASSIDTQIARFDGTTGKVIDAASVTISDAGAIGNVNELKFDTTPAGVTGGSGSISWNSSEGTLDLVMNGGNVTQHIGEETFYTARNATGSTINKATAVYASGVTAGSKRIEISPMIADGSIDELRYMGLTSENISNGVNGLVTEFGYIRNIDTTGSPYGETWADGDIIYVSPTTAGGLTNVEPIPPDIRIVVAIVIDAASSTGVLFVRPTPYPHLSHLSDVYLQSITGGDLLVWSSVNGRWDNAAQSTITAGKATNLAGGATGSLPYQSAADTTTFLAAGTDGQVLTLASGVPSWATSSGGVTITDDTTTNATRYLTFTDATTGTETGLDVSSTKLQFNPSTGDLTAAGNLFYNGGQTPTSTGKAIAMAMIFGG